MHGDLLSITPTKKLEELEIRYLRGEYQELLEEIPILFEESTEETERVLLQFLRARCYSELFEIYQEEEYIQKAFEVISEANEGSKALNDINLEFHTTTWKLWIFGWGKRREEAVELFEVLQNLLKDGEQKDPKYHVLRQVLLKITEPFVHNLKCILNNVQVNYSQIVQTNKEALVLLKSIDNLKRLDYLWYQLLNYMMLGAHSRAIYELDEAMSYYDQALIIAQEMNNEFFQSGIVMTQALIYRDKGDFENYLELSFMAIAQKERNGYMNSLAGCYGSLSTFYYTAGEMKKCLEYSLKAYNITSENGTNDNPTYLENISVAYINLGEYDKALETINKSLELYKKHSAQRGTYSSQENLAYVYYLRGELDKSIELQEETRDYYEKSIVEAKEQFFKQNFKWHLANNQGMIHFAYMKKGYIEKAIQALEKALTLYKETKNFLQAANVLFYLINISSNHKKDKLAKIYFDELKDILVNIDFTKVKRLQMLAEGVMLKSSEDSRDRVRAEVIFDQLLQEDLGFYLTIETLFNQCDLLLSELKATGNKNVLANLQDYVGKLIDISKNKNVEGLLIESLWFKAQLLLLEGKYEEAKTILTESSNIAEEKGYSYLALKINSSKDESFRILLEADKESKFNLSFAEKMSILNIEDSFEEIKEKQSFDISELKLKVEI